MRVDDLEEMTTTAAAPDLGRGFVAALAAKDPARLRAMFAGAVDFRGLTPGRSWEARTAAAVVDEVIFGAWFEPGDIIERVESAETGAVGDRHSLGYRLVVSNSAGQFAVEQRAFYDLTDGQITWMRVLCSGFRPMNQRR